MNLRNDMFSKNQAIGLLKEIPNKSSIFLIRVIDLKNNTYICINFHVFNCIGIKLSFWSHSTFWSHFWSNRLGLRFFQGATNSTFWSHFWSNRWGLRFLGGATNSTFGSHFWSNWSGLTGAGQGRALQYCTRKQIRSKGQLISG